MAIMLDGNQIVRYTAPKTYTAPKPATTVRYTAPKTQPSGNYLQYIEQQKQQQQKAAQQAAAARQAEAARLAAQARAYQQQQQKQNLSPFGMPSNVFQQIPQTKQNAPGYVFNNTNANSQAQPDRWATMPKTNAQTTQSQPRGGTTPGGATWRMGLDTYQPAPDYREQYGNILMSQDEYIKRMNTWNKMYQSGYKDWIGRAASTPNQSHDIFSQWYQSNPKPAGFLATYDEWNKRNMAAPAGYMWQPFGTGYAKLNTAPATGSAPSNGGYGDYYTNYPNYSGGGGGGGYTSKPPEWWVEMVQWRI